MLLFSLSMVVMLLLGFPFIVVMLAAILLYFGIYMPSFNFTVIVQQVLGGIKPASLVCVPMFILAANIITAGDSAKRLIRVIKAYIGHMPGGMAITTNAACTMFGAISGSTQATVAAIGGTMRPMLLKSGYPSPFTFGLIINSSDIAMLIPPSIGFIMYGVVTKTSVGQLFLSGIGPGLLIFFLFSVYCFFYSKKNNFGISEKASRDEKKNALKSSVLVIGFPVIIIGGIYTGIFTPTEASAISVVYALFIELVFYKVLKLKDLKECFLSTGIITGAIFILIGGGQAVSYVLTYLGIPQAILPKLFGPDPTQLQVILVVVISFFVACMLVDPVVAIYVLAPILHPYVMRAGIDPIFIGCLVVLQVAIGSATPPFGIDIFTAQMIFKRPYLEIIRHTPPFLIILLLVTVLLIIFPEIALFIPELAMRN